MKNLNSKPHPPHLCIVIPTYNEKENLATLIPKIEHILQTNKITASILVVDDNSQDGTAQLAENLAKQHGNIHILNRPGKLGLGSAYKDGFKHAIEQLNATILMEMDADLSHNPQHIPNFLKKLNEGYDIVVGSRRIPGGKTVGWGSKRHLTSWIANQIARLACGLRLTDATSGYRAYTSNAIQKINLTHIKSNGFDFQIETLFHAHQAGLKAVEVPIIFIDRKKEKSKLGLSEITRYISTSLKLMLQRS